MDHAIEIFKSGVQNFFTNELIADDSAQDSLGFITQDGRLKLSPGRLVVGSVGTVGQIRGLWFGYKVDGTQVMYRKTETTIGYLKNGAWFTIISSLTSGSEAIFANYSSLAGTFTFVVTVDGYWKIHNAFPENPLQMYSSSKNFHGRIFIDKGRTILYRRDDTKNAGSKDMTGLYGSKIDPQNGTVYTTVTGEATTSLGGTLAFPASTRNCFGLKITLTGTGEVYTDNFLGVLTGSLGGTGTINYITGVYTLTNAGVGLANYQWEDSNTGGLTDFTKSGTRTAGEGFVVPQDQGGDAIQTVLIGPDGAYYSLKQNSTYRFAMDTTDLQPDNNIYYQNMGVPSLNAGVATQKGIVFINTANPGKPEMTVLQKSMVATSDPTLSGNVLPVVVFPNFKFSLFDFSDSYFAIYDRYIAVSCKQQGSANNDRTLLCNISDNSVDILPYAARMFAGDASQNFYAGSPYSQTVEQILSGFDDEGDVVQNYWISAASRFSGLKTRSMMWRFIAETLKKNKYLTMHGMISTAQTVQVYAQYDDAGFQLIGTILGTGSYVDSGTPQMIGSNFIGTNQVGGIGVSSAYPYFWQIKMHRQPKFRKRAIKLVATGIGYFDVSYLADMDIMLFENRIPSRFREKQRVSYDGTKDNQQIQN